MSIAHGEKHGDNFPQATVSMLERGQDPKEMLIEVCRPFCVESQEKLKRCELKLKSFTHSDPEKSCMYRLRDWVTCIDGCVQPKIHKYLVGQERGIFS